MLPERRIVVVRAAAASVTVPRKAICAESWERSHSTAMGTRDFDLRLQALLHAVKSRRKMLRRSSKVSLRGDSARDSFSSYLLKRSGGHEGHTTLRKKFQERFFVLQGTNLLYFRSQDEYLAGGASLGSLR